ncbi:hypothetical protein ABSL23_01500 [Halobacterium sp. NMX12-1]|uniref:DUF927 domain-containing protein n=1 Tax=Halobacterium sp. NMX12-1 TaxID=3166650 RepID=A0AAU8CC65_9EURY
MTGDGDEETVHATDDLEFEAETLRYIQTRGLDDKRPKYKWGGYSQDFGDAEHVYTLEDVIDHPEDNWAIVDIGDAGAEHPRSLLIIDIDLYKADDPCKGCGTEDVDEAAKKTEYPQTTPITKSQTGGFHVYAWIEAECGSISPSDFELADGVPYDIDVKGSAVSGHVVAPNDIQGVESGYELVQDDSIVGVIEPGDILQDITYDGKTALKYRPGANSRQWDGDLPEEPPEDIPECYGRALQLRRKAPDDHGNTHKVNVLAALCGLAAGYEAEEVAGHMCGEFAPSGDSAVADVEETQYQVDHIGGMLESGRYSPPALSTLRSYGILDDDESCGPNCPIESHDTRTRRERDAAKTVREFIDEYDPVEDRPEVPDSDDSEVSDEDVVEAKAEWPDNDELNDVADAVPNLTDRDYDNLIDDLDDRLKTKRSAIDRHRDLVQLMWETGGDIVNYDGKLVEVYTGNRFVTSKTLLNFEMDITSRLSIEGEGRMANVKVRPSEPTEAEFDLQIEPRVFNDVRRFKDEVLAKRFSTTIETSTPESDVMDMLRKYISRQDVPELTGQKAMGLAQNGDEFVTPNGVIDVDGWVDEPETVFVEQDAAAERKFEANPDDHDAGEIGNDDVAEILELFAGTRDPERFIPVLGWLYAAPYRERIVETSGSMNLLFITGESGVGKSGTLKIANRMFGLEEAPFSASDTKFAHIKTFASSNGVPVWLDEYKTSEMADWEQSNLHELLRKVATGGVEQRGRADQSTVQYKLRAPVVVSGETSLQGSAEQRRAISTTFTNQPTVPGTPEYQRFKELAGDAVTDEDGNVSFPETKFELEQHAVEYYRHVADTSRQEFEEMWFNAREYVSKRLAEWGVELDDLEVQGLQTVVFGYKVMRSFAHVVGADLGKLPDHDDLDAALRYVADVEGDGRETHIDQLTHLVQRAAVADYLEKGKHYGVVRAGKSGEELRVNVTRAFDEISRYVRDHDLNEDLLGSAKDYKDRYSEAVEQDTYVTTTSQGTPGIGRCVGIHTDRAEDELTEFDRTVFIDGADIDELDAEIVDDDDNPDVDRAGSDDANVLRKQATSMARLGDRVGDYLTVTVEVVDWDPTPDKVVEADGPVAAGSVRDETGRRNVVMFDGDEPDGITHFEPGETVCIRDAPVTEYERSPQLHLDSGTTITHIQRGVGYTEAETPEDGQAALGETSSQPVEATGGKPQRDRVISVKDVIKSVEGGDGATVGQVLARLDEKGFKKEKAEQEIEKLKHRGEVYEPAENRLRVTGS